MFYLFNRALFPCLQNLILTLGELGEFSKAMPTLHYVSGLHNCLEFSQPFSCLDDVV